MFIDIHNYKIKYENKIIIKEEEGNILIYHIMLKVK